MMKKYYYMCFSALVMLFTALTFCSCGDDDDVRNENSEIIGTWRAIYAETENYYEDFRDDDYIISLRFDKGGTGLFQEIEDGDIDKEYFRYDYDSKLGTIHLIYDDFEDYLKISMTKDRFKVLHDFNDNFFEGVVFQRQ